MSVLNEFMELLSGHFDNSKQFEKMKKEGKVFPLARHINTVCNDRIDNIPAGFNGIFMLEESYYTTDGRTHASPHLFLFTEGEDGSVKLSSYDMPKGYDNDSFTFERLGRLDFKSLQPSVKFTPAVYRFKDGCWEGGSVSMFSPVLKFTLFERFSRDRLEVSETMEVNGKRTFGYDDPIIYKRCSL